jgi:hypothetical protein
MVISIKQVTELGDFFAKANLPKVIDLSSGVKITEVSKFIKRYVEVFTSFLQFRIAVT